MDCTAISGFSLVICHDQNCGELFFSRWDIHLQIKGKQTLGCGNLEKLFVGLNVHPCTPLIHGSLDPVGSMWRSKSSASVKPCKQIDSNATPRRLQLLVGFDQFCALLHIPTIHLEDQIEKSYTFNTSCWFSKFEEWQNMGSCKSYLSTQHH